MISRSSIVQQVSEALARGATVITSNQRAARTLSALQSGSMGEVLPWSGWITQQWRKRMITGLEDRILLNSSQELRLWENIFAEDARNQSLQAARSLANLAATAAKLVYEWNLRGALYGARSSMSGDAETFLRCFSDFERRCARSGWMANAAAPQALAESLNEGPWLQMPKELFFVGFDFMTPTQNRLLDALQSAGTNIQNAEAASEATTIQVAACKNSADEMAQCAHWISGYLAHTPQARIAIVVPDAESVRAALDRTLREHVAPAMHRIEVAADHAPWEFSLGRTLGTLPMTRHALLLLHWLRKPLPFEDASELIRSPYLGSEATLAERAELDAFVLRQAKQLTSDLSLEDLIATLNQDRKDTPPSQSLQDLRDSLKKMEEGTKKLRTLSWSAWADLFAERLRLAGWPGTRAMDSHEFQLQTRWSELLDEMAALDLSGEVVSFDTALRTLEAMITSTLFAPESHHAPVQIVSPLEAAGSEFDALWFLHADDQHWPVPQHANPLLPFVVQRERGMPGADPAYGYQFAATVSNRLLRSAPTAILSYSQHSATGEELRISPLFRTVTSFFDLAELESWTPAVVLETAEDDLPLPALPSSRIRGGASVLQAMAACPFQAFAVARLFSAEPGDVDHGMNPMERGNAVHGVLQEFWVQTKTHAALKDLSEEKLDDGSGLSKRDERLKDCIQKVLAQPAKTAWERAYLQLEATRLHTLLSAWLDEELKRQPFTVLYTEHEVPEARIGPLTFKLRVDRVDSIETPEGNAGLLIDYKTGIASPGKDWAGERLDKPQLPLYAVAGAIENISGIAYANVRAGEKGMGLRGISTPTDLVQNAKNAPAFEDALAAWDEALHQLARQFAEGHAAVDPKQVIVTCAHCTQNILCRINAGSVDDVENEDTLEGEL